MPTARSVNLGEPAMLSNLSVKKPYVVVVFIIIVAILGGVAYMNMTVDLLPNMNLPYIAIIVVSPGASPEEVENTICGPIEQAIATIDNVKRINSTSNEHYGLIIMEFSTIGCKINFNTSHSFVFSSILYSTLKISPYLYFWILT